MKTVVLYPNDFKRQDVWEGILHDLGVPEKDWNRVNGVDLRFDPDRSEVELDEPEEDDDES